jgi:hypothetical protein
MAAFVASDHSKAVLFVIQDLSCVSQENLVRVAYLGVNEREVGLWEQMCEGQAAVARPETGANKARLR